jgi:hypothetical protein
MDKNIAAILREDAKTVSVQFMNNKGSTQGSSYTYITHLDVKVGDFVVVPAGYDNELKVCEVTDVHEDFQIEPNADCKFKWIIDVVDIEAARENQQRNKEIESMLAASYRTNARQAYAHQFLAGADPKVLALVKGNAQ